MLSKNVTTEPCSRNSKLWSMHSAACRLFYKNLGLVYKYFAKFCTYFTNFELNCQNNLQRNTDRIAFTIGFFFHHVSGCWAVLFCVRVVTSSWLSESVGSVMESLLTCGRTTVVVIAIVVVVVVVFPGICDWSGQVSFRSVLAPFCSPEINISMSIFNT